MQTDCCMHEGDHILWILLHAPEKIPPPLSQDAKRIFDHTPASRDPVIVHTLFKWQMQLSIIQGLLDLAAVVYLAIRLVSHASYIRIEELIVRVDHSEENH